MYPFRWARWSLMYLYRLTFPEEACKSLNTERETPTPHLTLIASERRSKYKTVRWILNTSSTPIFLTVYYYRAEESRLVCEDISQHTDSSQPVLILKFVFQPLRVLKLNSPYIYLARWIFAEFSTLSTWIDTYFTMWNLVLTKTSHAF